MAFANKIGSFFKHAISSKPSIYQTIRLMTSSKLFVGGLSYATDDQSLREAFSGYGEVVEARVIIDRETGRSRGFGFITYTSGEEASAAVTAMDGKDLHGRMVRVNYATDRRPGFGGGYGGGGGGYGGGGGGYGGGYGGGGYGGGGGGYGGGGDGGYSGGGGYGNSGGDGGYSGSYENSGGDKFGTGGGFSAAGDGAAPDVGGNYVAGGVGGGENYAGTGFGYENKSQFGSNQGSSSSNAGISDDFSDDYANKRS